MATLSDSSTGPAAPANSTPAKARSKKRYYDAPGAAQLSLVEHALCALDPAVSLARDYRHHTGFHYTDDEGKRRFASVEVIAPNGLSPRDEFVLWSLLALAFSQPEPTIEFWATPHWCLKKMGLLETKQTVPGRASISKGGENYADFRASIERLAAVYYRCDHFWDPVRKERRQRGFGFLKYDLPEDPASSRAWRIVFDPLLFEFCRATGGAVWFDLTFYRRLDFASRRLFLLLSKIFWRHAKTPRFDVAELTTHGLGFSKNLRMPQRKQKLVRVMQKLLDTGAIRLPEGALTPQDSIQKLGKGRYAVRFERGPYFDNPIAHEQGEKRTADLGPLAEPLATIGFTPQQIRGIAKKYSRKLVEVWSDVTLRKIERDGLKSFRRSPQAFLLDNLKHAARKERSLPDWYREERKAAEKARRDAERFSSAPLSDEELARAFRADRRRAFRDYVQAHVSRDDYQQVVEIFQSVHSASLPADQAREQAIADAERHFEAGFRFPEFHEWRMAHECGNSPLT